MLGGSDAGRSDVTDVFVTHGHGDHTAGRPRPSAAPTSTSAPAIVALAEKKVAARGARRQGVTAKVMSYPGHHRRAIRSPAPTTFDVGEGADAKKVKAFPIPGHTPGSYAFLYDGVLFVGDVMIFKQGRLDPRAQAVRRRTPTTTRRSISPLKKQLENEEIDIVCTGHGGCTPKGLGRNQLTDLVARL